MTTKDTKGVLTGRYLEIDEKTFDRLKYAREIAQKSLDDRRDKAWKIFSWTSSILLAVTGGLVAIAGKDETRIPLFPHGTFLCFSILVLTLYACVWINQNQNMADDSGKIVRAYDEHLGIQTGYTPKKIVVGYITTVALLAGAATLAIFFISAR